MLSTILLAEDEAFLQSAFQLALEDNGAIVHTAMNGEEVIRQIDTRVPDLLLLDLLMPKKDGYAVLAHIREKGYRFPVVILSNLEGEIDKDTCLALGAVDYIVKSDTDEDELWMRIKPYLD